jgi:hypothetical protein
MSRGPIEQPGLRLRLHGEVRRISSQHRQLDLLYAAVVEAFESGSGRETGDALGRFRDAFDAHTRLEDGFYFPALRGLRPELAGPLEVFVREHGRFREDFARLAARLSASGLEGFGDVLDAFAAELADHEAREEALLAGQSGVGPA